MPSHQHSAVCISLKEYWCLVQTSFLVQSLSFRIGLSFVSLCLALILLPANVEQQRSLWCLWSGLFIYLTRKKKKKKVRYKHSICPICQIFNETSFFSEIHDGKGMFLYHTATTSQVVCDSIKKILIMCLAITFSLTAFSRHSTNLVTEPECGLRSPWHKSVEGSNVPLEIIQ